MIISDLSHLESVTDTQGLVGGWYGPSTLISFSVFNSAYVSQSASSNAYGGNATSGIGSSSANAAAFSSNSSTIQQSNYVVGVGIGP